MSCICFDTAEKTVACTKSEKSSSVKIYRYIENFSGDVGELQQREVHSNSPDSAISIK